MISLYPSHIYISFPYSHILPYPYISHIHVSIFLSAPPVALPLVFFISHFLWCRNGACFSCGFLVSVLWMFFDSFFASPLVSFFVPFFSLFRLSPRPSVRCPVSLLASLFAQPLVSFFRLGVSGGRFVGRAVLFSSFEQAGVCSFSCLDTVGRCVGVSYR